ncbi:MAG: PEGA domain-containing protein [Myxococcales bacterium]
MKRGALYLALCSSLCALPAFADPPSELERAKDSFKAGAAAYAAGDYLAAIQALDAAYQLTPLPAIAFSLGQAERRQYFVDHSRPHLDRAISLFRHYIDVAPAGSRRADALDALSQLEPLAAAQPKSSGPSAPRPPESARRTRVLITSDAPNARLALDGAPGVGSPLIREVEPGKHYVTVEASGFHAAQRELTAIAGELALTQVSLRERPSILSIWTSPDAEIYIDGSYTSPGGEGVVLQLSSGKHRLAVAQNGHRVAIFELMLERGKAQTIRVPLEQTPQRYISQALFIGGGAALGASLVFSALTIQAEGRAEEFLGRHGRQNVTGPDLYSYRSSILDRDRYRLGTAVCLTASAGFFITGLFLHELDRPNPQLLYRTGPRLGAPAPAPARASLQIAPLAYGGAFGAMVGGTF